MSKPETFDSRLTPPKHHPASRGELFDYSKKYAIWEEERGKRKAMKRVMDVDVPLLESIDEWVRFQENEKEKMPFSEWLLRKRLGRKKG